MDRSRLYKNAGKNNEEQRRRRIDQSVELRKAKKDEQLQKRRNVLVELQETELPKDKSDKFPVPIDYDNIVAEMGSPDLNVVMEAAQNCRKILSRAKNPPLDEFFERGAHKILAELLDSDDSNVVFEAAWALTNIASGHSYHTKGVVKTGAVPRLIRLLSHRDIRIAEQCVWALGNIAGDGPKHRDMLIQQGVVEPSLELLHRAWDSPNVVSNVAWMLSNLCRNKNPNPPLKTVLRFLPVFAQLLEYPHNQEAVVDTAWAISYISDCGSEFIDVILKSDCSSILVRHLGSELPNLVSPALRAIGNLILGNDNQTQAVIDCGVLQYVPKLLESDRSNIVKETCWMLSNIAAGSLHQIQMVINAGVIPKVIDVVREAEFKVQKEACWALCNVVVGGSNEHRAFMLNAGILNPLGKMLEMTDARMLRLALETLNLIFGTAEKYGQLDKCCLAFEQCNALSALEKLQDHQNQEIYEGAYNFISLYFNNDDDEEVSPAVDNLKTNPTDPIPQQDSNEFQFQPYDSRTGSTHFDF